MKKVIGIFVCMLLVGTVLTVTGTQINSDFSLSYRDLPNSSGWTEKQKLLASDGTLHFGGSVSIDGDTALIGAEHDNENGNASGSAYIFTRIGNTWTEQAKLLPSDGKEDGHFGCSVSLDGDTALIGTDDYEDYYNPGSAYVFTRNGNTWTEQAKLLPSDGDHHDYFGRSVSLDGNTALIGAIGADQYHGSNIGSAYVFKRISNYWVEQAKLLPSDGEHEDFFGWSVSLDGDTALIGTRHDDDNGDSSGSAYVFTRIGSTWTEKAKLLALDGEEYDWFGYSVSLDGDTALIGAYHDDDNDGDSGSAYVFTHDGNTWTEQGKLLPLDGDGNDKFGISVSLDEDTAIIGAKYNDDNGKNSGSAYIFKRNSNIWIEQAKLLASDGEEWDLFGLSVSIDGMYAIVGSITDNTDGWGSVYVFIENEKPIMPIITGPSSGIPGIRYNYNFICVDPDGDDITYHVEWDDGDVDIGIVESGEVLSLFHTWTWKGDFTLRAKLIDEYELESEWATLEVSMPRNRMLTNTFFMRFLERFPLLERYLSLLIN